MQKVRVLIATLACITLYNSSQAQINDYSVGSNNPQTVINATIIVEKEVIKKGPYARFAQKYLGVIAPLSDKVTYSIKEAALSSRSETTPSSNSSALGVVESRTIDITSTLRTRYVNPSDTTFSRLPADKISSVDMSAEEMAAAAAAKIFTIRKRRFDLITGEAGENVFGAGLGAAIAEMKRLEDEYISLFMGVQFTTVQAVKSYEIIPQRDKTTIIVCRFSPAKGLVVDNDLSARPIVLQLNPEITATDDLFPRKDTKDKRPTITQVVPNFVECVLSDGNTILDNKRVPINQFGKLIEIPNTTSK